MFGLFKKREKNELKYPSASGGSEGGFSWQLIGIKHQTTGCCPTLNREESNFFKAVNLNPADIQEDILFRFNNVYKSIPQEDVSIEYVFYQISIINVKLKNELKNTEIVYQSSVYFRDAIHRVSIIDAPLSPAIIPQHFINLYKLCNPFRDALKVNCAFANQTDHFDELESDTETTSTRSTFL